MTDTTDKVSLKEHLEQRIDALEKKFEKAEKNRDENLKLQARETERRLLDLNHENARMQGHHCFNFIWIHIKSRNQNHIFFTF